MNGNQAVAGQVSASGAGRLDFAVGEGGTLTLVLFESGNRTGNFGVAITRLNRPCGSGTVACGAITQSSIGSEFNIDSFTLAANPGDVLSFRTTALGSGLVPYVEAYDGLR